MQGEVVPTPLSSGQLPRMNFVAGTGYCLRLRGGVVAWGRAGLLRNGEGASSPLALEEAALALKEELCIDTWSKQNLCNPKRTPNNP